MIRLLDKDIDDLIETERNGDRSHRERAREILTEWALEAAAELIEVTHKGASQLSKYLA